MKKIKETEYVKNQRLEKAGAYSEAERETGDSSSQWSQIAKGLD